MGIRQDTVQRHRTEIAEAISRHRGRSIALFGSAARGTDSERSDLDFLVEFERDSSLLDLLRLQDELESILDCKVDVVSTRGLKASDHHIRAEAIPL